MMFSIVAFVALQLAPSADIDQAETAARVAMMTAPACELELDRAAAAGVGPVCAEFVSNLRLAVAALPAADAALEAGSASQDVRDFVEYMDRALPMIEGVRARVSDRAAR